MRISWVFLGIAVLFLAGCADVVTPAQLAQMEKVGFWMGCWHGLISPFALVGSWFNDSIAVMAEYNNGFFYKLGFWGSVIIFWGLDICFLMALVVDD